MGLVGLAPFLVILGIIGTRTWFAVRREPTEAGPWCATWVIFTSACFGVVLEGPMGAVVFWTILGLASASAGAAESENPMEAKAPTLPTPISTE